MSLTGFTLSLASQHEFKLPVKELQRFCYKMISCYKLVKIVKVFYIAREVKSHWVVPESVNSFIQRKAMVLSI